MKHDTLSVLQQLYKYFKLKTGFLVEPDIYLVGKLNKTKLHNEVWCRYFSPTHYVYWLFEENGEIFEWEFCSKVEVSNARGEKLFIGYQIDSYSELEMVLYSYYQPQIDNLIWVVEVGSVDINTEV